MTETAALPSGIILWVAEPCRRVAKRWAPCNLTYADLQAAGRGKGLMTNDGRRFGWERPNDQAVFAVQPLVPWLRRIPTGTAADGHKPTRFDLFWPDTGKVLEFGQLEHGDEYTHDFQEMMFSALRFALAGRATK